MRTCITPSGIAPPFANYSHGVRVDRASQILFVSGQLGITALGEVPESAEAQAELCFGNIDAILREGGMDRRHVARINAFVSAREYLAGYMAARDRWIEGLQHPPASTLMIVLGFARAEFKVEVEVTAAG